MVEPFFFGLGLVNSLALTAVFLTRRRNMALLEKVGWLYLVLAVPAVYGIFLAFLVIESLDGRRLWTDRRG